MLPCFTDTFGNPSSIFSYKRELKGAIEEDIELVLEILPRIVTRLKAMLPLIKSQRQEKEKCLIYGDSIAKS